MQFEEQLMKNSNCISHFEYDKYHVMYIFNIPKEFEKDIENFTEGKYSKFSNKLKKRIESFYGDGKKGNVAQVVYRSEKLKQNLEEHLGIRLSENMELASKPDLEKNEICKINMIQ